MTWRLPVALYLAAALLAALTIARPFGQVLAVMLAAVALLVTAVAVHDWIARRREISRPHVVDLATVATSAGRRRAPGRHGRRKARRFRA